MALRRIRYPEEAATAAVSKDPQRRSSGPGFLARPHEKVRRERPNTGVSREEVSLLCVPTRRSCASGRFALRRYLAPSREARQAHNRHRYSDRAGPSGIGRAFRICRDQAIPRRPLPGPGRCCQPRQFEAARPTEHRARRDLCFLIGPGLVRPVPRSRPDAYRVQREQLRAA
jgi:hypothetical protein